MSEVIGYSPRGLPLLDAVDVVPLADILSAYRPPLAPSWAFEYLGPPRDQYEVDLCRRWGTAPPTNEDK